MAPEDKFYPLLRLPPELTNFGPWLKQHNKGCNDWLLRWKTLKAASFNSPLSSSDMRKLSIKRMATNKFKTAANMYGLSPYPSSMTTYLLLALHLPRFANNRIDRLVDHSSPWAGQFLKGWKNHLEERDLFYRFRLHSIESSNVLGASLFVDYGGSFPDPVVGGKICACVSWRTWCFEANFACTADWSDGRYATALLPARVDTFPREWYNLKSPIDTIFRQNQRGQSDIVVWVHFVTRYRYIALKFCRLLLIHPDRERFEVYSSKDGKPIFKQDGTNEHIWKFGKRLPKSDSDVQSPAFQWKIYDIDNQVFARATQILKEDHLFADETQNAKRVSWLQLINE